MKAGEFAMCGTKSFFDTAFEAEVYAAKKYGDPTLHAYKCRFCKMYHVGHSKKYKYKKPLSPLDIKKLKEEQT